MQQNLYVRNRTLNRFAYLLCEHRSAPRWAAAVVLPKTAPLWTKQMAHPQTDTHAREQTKRDEQAHKNGDAARAGVEKLANFRQRATEDAWRSMESGMDTASQGFQNASDQ